MADGNKLHSINTSRILRTIWLNPGISRIKVAELLDLDRSTVTKIMQVILERELAVTVGKNEGQTGVGRRQICLKINESAHAVLGVEIQDTRYGAVITTITGKVLHTFSACGVTTKKETLVRRMAEIVTEAKKRLAGSGVTLLGACVALPGIVDPYTGTLIRGFSFGVSEPWRVRDEFERACGLHVLIENDANCCCWGELAFKPENRARNFVAVLGEFRDDVPDMSGCHGLAIGLGIVIRERVLHGDQFTVGEFRSMKATKETGQFTIPCEALRDIPENTAVLREAYAELAENLAFLVNCLDLTKIVFAGDFADKPENLRSLVAEAVQRNWMYDLDRALVTEFSEYGDSAVSIGAAGYFIEKLFSVPDVADRFQELVGYDLYESILGRKG